MALTIVSGRFTDTEGVPIAKTSVDIYTLKGGFFKNKELAVKTDKLGNFTFKLNQPSYVKEYYLTLSRNNAENALFSTEFQVEPGQSTVQMNTTALNLYTVKDETRLFDLSNLGFYAELAKNATASKFKEIFATFNPCITTEQIQAMYGDSRLELNDDNVIDMLFNGLFPAIPRHGNSPGEIIYRITWDGAEKDGSADLPDAEITLYKRDGKYKIKDVAVRYENEPWLRKRKKEGTEYLRVLHLAVSMAAVQGEAVHHLGIGHLIMGLYTQAYLFYIHYNPILHLLKAHLTRATIRINQLGAELVFNNGVLNLSGLSAKGIEALISHHLAHVDYSRYEPRKSLSGQNTFAMALKLYWKFVVKPSVDQFFEENQAEIIENWNEIYQMSENLVKNSVDYREMPEEENALIDNFEIDRNPLERREIDGKRKSFRPITENASNPSPDDIDRLKRWCCHAIQLSTLWHTQLHNSQKKFVTDLRFATLAPQMRGFDEGQEHDLYLNTKPADAAKQLSVVNTLVGFQATKLLEDPEVWGPLKERLARHRLGLEKRGCDIDAIMSTVAI